ncbi:MAG: hypothetical protein ABWY64_04720 [Tardiphaga sp.]
MRNGCRRAIEKTEKVGSIGLLFRKNRLGWPMGARMIPWAKPIMAGIRQP